MSNDNDVPVAEPTVKRGRQSSKAKPRRSYAKDFHALKSRINFAITFIREAAEEIPIGERNDRNLQLRLLKLAIRILEESGQ